MIKRQRATFIEGGLSAGGKIAAKSCVGKYAVSPEEERPHGRTISGNKRLRGFAKSMLGSRDHHGGE